VLLRVLLQLDLSNQPGLITDIVRNSSLAVC